MTHPLTEYSAADDELLHGPDQPLDRLSAARGIMHGVVFSLGLWIAGGVIWSVL